MPSCQWGGRDTERNDCSWSTRKEPAVMWSAPPAAGHPATRTLLFCHWGLRCTLLLHCATPALIRLKKQVSHFWTETISVLMWYALSPSAFSLLGGNKAGAGTFAEVVQLSFKILPCPPWASQWFQLTAEWLFWVLPLRFAFLQSREKTFIHCNDRTLNLSC